MPLFLLLRVTLMNVEVCVILANGCENIPSSITQILALISTNSPFLNQCKSLNFLQRAPLKSRQCSLEEPDKETPTSIKTLTNSPKQTPTSLPRDDGFYLPCR